MTHRHTKARLRMSIVGAAVVVAVTLSSCLVLPFVNTPSPTGSTTTRGSDGPGANPTSTPITKPPLGQEKLASYYAQQLSWRSCSGGECATMSVPLDYACLLYTSPSPRD